MAQESSIQPTIAAVWKDVRSYVDGESFTETQGEFNKVLIVNGRKPSVVKIPHSHHEFNIRLLQREAEAVMSLESASIKNDTEPPVVVPHSLGYNNDAPFWAAYSLVPGQVLTRQELAHELSPDEFKAFGRKVGEFVAYIARTLDAETFYQEVEGYPGTYDTTDRERMLTEGQVSWKKSLVREKGYNLLADVLGDLGKEHGLLHVEGALVPSIIGHDDLHPGNTTFLHGMGTWQFAGVFDFGNIKPSSPEREFRFLPHLHPDALQTAMETYEEQTGQPVDEDLVDFWCRAQTVTLCANLAVRGSVSDEAYPDLQPITRLSKCYPEEDWQAEFNISATGS